MKKRRMRRRGWTMTHRATVRGPFGRSRVRMRECETHWVTSAGLRFRKDNGECGTDLCTLLLPTVERIACPDGVDVEIFPVGGKKEWNTK